MHLEDKKKNPFPAIVVSGDHGSAGKTTLTMGLLSAYRARGLTVRPYKKGPDFIDPLWLSRAAGVGARNLDFFTGKDRILPSFLKNSAGYDLSLIEGNKGLFDGVDTEGSDSTSALARLLGAPVVLVVDCTKMSRGVAPLVQGYLNFETNLTIGGVILNNVSGDRHQSKLLAALEYYTDAKIFGAVPRNRDAIIRERHLGLVPVGENRDADRIIEENRKAVEEHVDLEAIYELAQTARLPLSKKGEEEAASGSKNPLVAASLEATSPQRNSFEDAIRIGVARDEAFCFYYEENLEALREAGAEIVEFSPLKDRNIPDVDALYIGGGFPEEFAQELSANTGMIQSIRDFIDSDLPVYAECGGLMYLSSSIEVSGIACEMVDRIKLDSKMEKRPVGRGYVIVETSELQGVWGEIPSGVQIRAHEFHHSRTCNPSSDLAYGYRVLRGHGVDGQRDGVSTGSVFASYAHLHCYSAPWWPEVFVKVARKQKQEALVQRAGAEKIALVGNGSGIF